jgi:hypothetical protein
LADGEGWVVRKDGLDADENGVVGGAQLHDPGAGGGARDPTGFAGAGGDLAVEGEGGLEPRELELDGLGIQACRELGGERDEDEAVAEAEEPAADAAAALPVAAAPAAAQRRRGESFEVIT